MKLPLSSPPQSLCLLRLSAVGDISHTLPLLRTLQKAWPETRITWVIGRLEHTLVGDIPGVEFIIFDKARRKASLQGLKQQLAGRRFDVLLHMQTSLRASLISRHIRAAVRLGFDRARAKDLQWLFTNARIAPGGREHVLESFFGFSRALGIEGRELAWEIPIPDEARQFAREQLPTEAPLLVISPCSSKAHRNWTSAGYAAVAAHAIRVHGMRVVLSGGPSRLEWQYGAEIMARLDMAQLGGACSNLIGKTDLKQLLAVLERASAVVSPDAGPAHLATAVGTPVVGLYACTNPDRARPYLSADYVVSRYAEAVEAKYGKPPEQLRWGVRVKEPGTMERIAVQDVTDMLDRLLQDRRKNHHSH